MNDVERILGRLEEFKENTADRLSSIEDKIDDLQRFKWRIAGGSVVASFLATALLQYLRVLN